MLLYKIVLCVRYSFPLWNSMLSVHWFLPPVIRFGIEGPIYLTPKGDKGGDWVVDEVHQRVIKAGTNISYAVLQTVRIHMEVVEPQPHRPKLQLTLI
uniref:Cl19897_1 n=1 Tax=Arundo donax TaxID=35708 RepID=A0A0A9DG35_ARUDO